MAHSNLRVELGAWVEGTVAKKSNPAQMRKVWTTPAPKGANVKLAVIRAGERGDVHVISLAFGTDAERLESAEALALVLGALKGVPVPAKAPAAPAAPKAPAARVSNPAPTNNRDAIIAKAREERAALTLTPVAPKAPAKAPAAPKLDWFADLMSQAGA